MNLLDLPKMPWDGSQLGDVDFRRKMFLEVRIKMNNTI